MYSVSTKHHYKKRPRMGEWRGKVQVLNKQLIIHYIALPLTQMFYRSVDLKQKKLYDKFKPFKMNSGTFMLIKKTSKVTHPLVMKMQSPTCDIIYWLLLSWKQLFAPSCSERMCFSYLAFLLPENMHSWIQSAKTDMSNVGGRALDNRKKHLQFFFLGQLID